MKRRAAGTGTIVPRGARFMARLPDRKRTSLGVYATYEEAEQILDASIGELADGKIATANTLAAYGRTVLNRRELDGYRGVKNERHVWRAYVSESEIGDWPPSALQRSHVLAWVRELRGRKLATQTVRNALNLLRAVLSSALDDQLVDVNVAADVRVRDHGRVEEAMRCLSLDELAGLFWSADDEGKILIAVAAGAGLRQGEHRSLQWPDVVVDGDAPHLTIRYGAPKLPTKSGKPRRVPLFGLALEAMRFHRDRTPEKKRVGLVWPNAAGHARSKSRMVSRYAWVRWCAAAGLEGVRWHDLRHTAATLLLSGAWGVAWSLEAVREILGHSTVRVTERYAKLTGALSEALARRHHEGTKAPIGEEQTAAIALDLLRRCGWDLNPRVPVLQSGSELSDPAAIGRLRALVVRLLRRAATAGDVPRHVVDFLGEAIEEVDRAAPMLQTA